MPEKSAKSVTRGQYANHYNTEAVNMLINLYFDFVYEGTHVYRYIHIQTYINKCNNTLSTDEVARQFSITPQDKETFPFASASNIWYKPTGFQCKSYS